MRGGADPTLNILKQNNNQNKATIMRAKSKKQKDLLRNLLYLRNNRDKTKTREELAAQKYCYQNSQYTKTHNGLPETIFIGTPDKLTGSVLAELGGLRSGPVPECPQGLVIHDGKRTGAFD